MDYNSSINDIEGNETFYILYDQLIGIEDEVTLVKIVPHLEYAPRNKENIQSKQLRGPEITFYANGFNIEENLRVALLTIRQPVFNCVINPWMRLVIEVFLGSKGRITNNGSVCVEIFTQDGSLKYGRWRSEVNFNTDDVHSGIYLCYRLMHADDLHLETSMPSPAAVYAFYQEMIISPDELTNNMSTLGFSIDWIKNILISNIKVLLTLYDVNKNEVIQSRVGPVSCYAFAEASCYKTNYHEFGSLKSIFEQVKTDRELMLVVLVYEIPNLIQSSEIEKLIAWTFVSVVGLSADGFKLNNKTHILNLYQPPILTLSEMMNEGSIQLTQTNKATINLSIFTEDGNTSSAVSESFNEIRNENQNNSNREPPINNYSRKDGFDIHIHECKNLPSNIYLTILLATVFDKQQQQVGQHMVCLPTLDGHVDNQKYEKKIAFRLPDIPSTSTLLVEIFSFDKHFKKLMYIGSSVLNIFVESGTLHQPLTNNSMQVSLNVGKHQLPIYTERFNFTKTMSSNCFQASPRLPVSNILISICQKDEDVTQEVFTSYVRSNDEVLVGKGMMNKKEINLRQLLYKEMLSPNEIRKYNSDQHLNQLLMIKLANIIDGDSVAIDLSYFAPYEDVFGFNVSVFATLNLPWTSICMPMLALYPPGDIFKNISEPIDKPYFMDLPILDSRVSNSIWKEDTVKFENCIYDENLLLVVYLPGLNVISNKKGIEYTIINEAWTAKRIFTDEFVSQGFFNLPLYEGRPTESLLQFIREPEQLVAPKELKLVNGATLILAVSDARRKEEIKQQYIQQNNIINEPALSFATDISMTVNSEKLVSDLLPSNKLEDVKRSIRDINKQLMYSYFQCGLKTITKVNQVK